MRLMNAQLACHFWGERLEEVPSSLSWRALEEVPSCLVSSLLFFLRIQYVRALPSRSMRRPTAGNGRALKCMADAIATAAVGSNIML